MTTREVRAAQSFRRRAQRAFASEIGVRRATGETTINERYEVTPATREVYQGRSLIRPTTLQARGVLYGEAAVTTPLYDVQLPGDADVRPQDTIEVLSSPDESLRGRTLVVRESPGDDWLVVRSVVAEMVEEG